MSKKKEYTNIQVAEFLGISPGSLRNHISRDNCAAPTKKGPGRGHRWFYEEMQTCKRELKDRLPKKAKARKL